MSEARKARRRGRPRLTAVEMQNLVHEAYAAHYVIMGMGFTADELFAGALKISNWNPPGLCAVVVLRAQDKQFVYVLRPLARGDDGRFHEAWTAFAPGELKVFVNGSPLDGA